MIEKGVKKLLFNSNVFKFLSLHNLLCGFGFFTTIVFDTDLYLSPLILPCLQQIAS